MKKWVLVLMGIGLLATMSSAQLYAQVRPAALSLSDVPPSHENADAVAYMLGRKIINGYDDGTFRPNAKINRAELIKIVIGSVYDNDLIAECPLDTGYLMSDVPQGAWFAPYVCTASAHKIISGYNDGTFKPEQPINFVEAAKIISQSLKLTGHVQDDPDPWYKNYVYRLEGAKAIPKSIYAFEKEITRGEMAEMVYRIITNTDSKESQTYMSIERSNEVDFENNPPQIGERFGVFTFTEKNKTVPNAMMTNYIFNGELQITGRYHDSRRTTGMTIAVGICFDELDVMSQKKLLKPQGNTNHLYLCVNNPEALEAVNAGREGRATITISNFSMEYMDPKTPGGEYGPTSSADIISVDSIQPRPLTKSRCDAVGGTWTPVDKNSQSMQFCEYDPETFEDICDEGRCENWLK